MDTQLPPVATATKVSTATTVSAATMMAVGAVAVSFAYAVFAGVQVQELIPQRQVFRMAVEGDTPPFQLLWKYTITDPTVGPLDDPPAFAGPAAADFDDDGIPEIVVPNLTKGVFVFKHNVASPGTWDVRWRFGPDSPGFPVGSKFAAEPLIADLDCDDVPEIVVGSWEAQTLYALRISPGADLQVLWSFQATDGFYPHFNNPAALGDRHTTPTNCYQDVVATADKYVYSLADPDHDGNGEVQWRYDLGYGVGHGPAVADINLDGRSDVVLGYPQHTVLYNQSRTGSGEILCSSPIGANIQATPAVGDLDGDGTLEIVVAVSPSGVRVGEAAVYALQYQSGNSLCRVLWRYQTPGSREVFYQHPSTLADFNGDGVLDVALGDNAGVIRVLDGQDGHELWSYTLSNPPSGFTPLVVADLNSNGVLDFLATPGFIWDATFTAVESFQTGPSLFQWRWSEGVMGDILSTPVVGDFDGDGRAEIAFGFSETQPGGGQHFGVFRVAGADPAIATLTYHVDNQRTGRYAAVGRLPAGVHPFRRADADGDGAVSLTDAIITLRRLFQGGVEPLCQDAADADDDGTVALTDAVFTLNYLFKGDGVIPPAPGPTTPGPDPTADSLGCLRYSAS